MIIESVQFSMNQVWAYNAILKYVVMGLTLYRIGCKGTEKFADVQILSRKSFRSLKSLKGIRLFEGVEIREMGHR